MDDELRELRERIAGMSDAELIRMVGKDRREYRAEAVSLAREELNSRQAAADSQADEFDNEADDSAGGVAVPSGDQPPCDLCGGHMRRAALFADRELTVYFDDTDEERFVEALVCSACGNLRLVVDLDTDVQE